MSFPIIPFPVCMKCLNHCIAFKKLQKNEEFHCMYQWHTWRVSMQKSGPDGRGVPDAQPPIVLPWTQGPSSLSCVVPHPRAFSFLVQAFVSSYSHVGYPPSHPMSLPRIIDIQAGPLVNNDQKDNCPPPFQSNTLTGNNCYVIVKAAACRNID